MMMVYAIVLLVVLIAIAYLLWRDDPESPELKYNVNYEVLREHAIVRIAHDRLKANNPGHSWFDVEEIVNEALRVREELDGQD